MNDKLPDEILTAIKDHYGFKVVSSKNLWSYFGGVSEILTDDGNSYVFKYVGNVNEKGLQHHLAVVEFCNYVEHNITEFVTQKFIHNKKGESLQYLWDNDYCYVVEKREIIHKPDITPEEQQSLGG